MSAEVTYLQVLQYQNNIVTTELGSYIYTTVLTLKGNLVTTSNATLFYIHDPMCSWCWGFRPVWEQLEQQLSTTVKIVYIVGGLAPDSDQPMAIPMQQTLAATWQRIQQLRDTVSAAASKCCVQMLTLIIPIAGRILQLE